MSKTRLAFIGVGGMGQAAHLRNYTQIPDCEIVALAEIRPELGKKVATRYGVPHVYENHRQLLEREELDGIIAIQQFGFHAELVPQLLEKGVPVLTEKPLADTIDNGRIVAGAVKKTGVPLYLAYHKRHDPAVQFVKKQMSDWQKSGRVGKLRYLRMTMPPGDWIAEGFNQLINTSETYEMKVGRSSRFGEFVNYYIHQVNLIRYLLSEDYRIVFADPKGITFTAVSSSGVSITLEMAPFHTTIDWKEEALLGYDSGRIELKLPAPLAFNRAGQVKIYEDPGKGAEPKMTEPTLPWVHAHRRQAENFVRAIRGEKTPLCEAEEGLRDLETAAQYVSLLEESEKKFA